MQCNLTVIGLSFDFVGFLVIFLFSFYSVGRGALLMESAKSGKSDKKECLIFTMKMLGLFMVLVGFGFQWYGAMYR